MWEHVDVFEKLTRLQFLLIRIFFLHFHTLHVIKLLMSRSVTMYNINVLNRRSQFKFSSFKSDIVTNTNRLVILIFFCSGPSEGNTSETIIALLKQHGLYYTMLFIFLYSYHNPVGNWLMTFNSVYRRLPWETYTNLAYYAPDDFHQYLSLYRHFVQVSLDVHNNENKICSRLQN